VTPQFDPSAGPSAPEPAVDKKKCLYPSLYQIDTRAGLHDLSLNLGRQATLDDIADQELDRLAERGFDWIWYLGVWQTGPAGRKVSRDHLEWQAEFRNVLPDFQQGDVYGSCFAITGYTVHSDFGGKPALERLRERIGKRGMHLMLDFVPNHTAPDHPWTQTHPEFYVRGTEEKLRQEPQNYVRVETAQGAVVLAYGRDPYFPGWPDTLQLNYAEPSLQEAMRGELLNVATLCDGVRCDMAMLLLPEVFERTWGLRPGPFWPNAIRSVRADHPGFLFMAEVYWDLEWTLQQQGFDYTYDKRLYDLLREGHAQLVRDHFRADIVFQRKSARFLENHDEPRAAAAFPLEVHQPAAVLTYLCPGLRFFHDGQFEGRTKKLSVHLGRRPTEPVESSLREFYERLLDCVHQPVARNGQWRLLDCSPAWDGNWTWDCFICFAWQGAGGPPLLVAVNYAANQSQCYVQIPLDQIGGGVVRMLDLLSPTVYESKHDLSRGLYLDMPAWGCHVFELKMVRDGSESNCPTMVERS
jgi:Alpha amylase, catalytic domain